MADQLTQPRPETRRSAVLRAAQLGGEDGWGLVLRGLADEESSVGDAAQRALGGCQEERVWGDLLGRAGLASREEGVRERAAEAVGRAPLALDAQTVALALDHRDEEAARLLLWSIERLHASKRLVGRVDRATECVGKFSRLTHSDELAGRAFLTSARLGAEGLERDVVERARDPRAPVRAAALLAATDCRLQGADALAGRALEDPDASVRAAALWALESLGTRASLRLLIARLEREERPGLRLRVVGALQRMTGLKYRADPRPWRLLAQGLAEDWTARRADPAAAEPSGSRAERLRLPVDSDRVAFLFDFSGSMWNRLPDGRTPKDVVADHLREVLSGLAPQTQFNLVPYASQPQPWKERLVPAKPAAVREAIAAFEDCQLRGRGNVYDAVRLALADPQVDRIVILTDGVPTGGRHSQLDLVVELLCEQDRLRGVAIDAVLVDAPRACVRRWQDLAMRTAGRTFEVSLQ